MRGMEEQETLPLKIRHSVPLLISLHLSIPHPSQSQSTLCNLQATYLPLPLPFLSVSDHLMAALLLYILSPTDGKSKLSYALSQM
jgi:hypothetical protein